MNETPLYTSQYEIYRCFCLTFLLFFGELLLGGLASIPFPNLYPDDSLRPLYYVILVSCILLWSFCWRVTCFYEDRIVLYYPLRLFSRRRTFTYDEISSIVFYDGDSMYSERHLLLRMEGGIKRSCSIDYNRKSSLKVLLLLRFLKRKGVRIEGYNVRNNDLDDCTEARIEMVFGTGEKHIRRLYRKDTKEDNRRFIIFFVILLSAFMLLWVLLFVFVK